MEHLNHPDSIISLNQAITWNLPNTSSPGTEQQQKHHHPVKLSPTNDSFRIFFDPQHEELILLPGGVPEEIFVSSKFHNCWIRFPLKMHIPSSFIRALKTQQRQVDEGKPEDGNDEENNGQNKNNNDQQPETTTKPTPIKPDLSSIVLPITSATISPYWNYISILLNHNDVHLYSLHTGQFIQHCHSQLQNVSILSTIWISPATVPTSRNDQLSFLPSASYLPNDLNEENGGATQQQQQRQKQQQQQQKSKDEKTPPSILQPGSNYHHALKAPFDMPTFNRNLVRSGHTGVKNAHFDELFADFWGSDNSTPLRQQKNHYYNTYILPYLKDKLAGVDFGLDNEGNNVGGGNGTTLGVDMSKISDEQKVPFSQTGNIISSYSTPDPKKASNDIINVSSSNQQWDKYVTSIASRFPQGDIAPEGMNNMLPRQKLQWAMTQSKVSSVQTNTFTNNSDITDAKIEYIDDSDMDHYDDYDEYYNDGEEEDEDDYDDSSSSSSLSLSPRSSTYSKTTTVLSTRRRHTTVTLRSGQGDMNNNDHFKAKKLFKVDRLVKVPDSGDLSLFRTEPPSVSLLSPLDQTGIPSTVTLRNNFKLQPEKFPQQITVTVDGSSTSTPRPQPNPIPDSITEYIIFMTNIGIEAQAVSPKALTRQQTVAFSVLDFWFEPRGNFLLCYTPSRVLHLIQIAYNLPNNIDSLFHANRLEKLSQTSPYTKPTSTTTGTNSSNNRNSISSNNSSTTGNVNNSPIEMIRLTRFEIDENPTPNGTTTPNSSEGNYSEEDEDDSDQNDDNDEEEKQPRRKSTKSKAPSPPLPTDQELLQQGLPTRLIRQYLQHDASNVVMLSPSLNYLQTQDAMAIHNKKLFLPFSDLSQTTTSESPTVVSKSLPSTNSNSKSFKKFSTVDNIQQYTSQIENGGLFAFNVDITNNSFTSSHSNSLIINSKLAADNNDQYYPPVTHSGKDNNATLPKLPNFSSQGPGGLPSTNPDGTNTNTNGNTTVRGYRLNLLTLYNRLYIALHDEASGALLLFTQNERGILVQTHTFQTQCRGRCVISVKNDVVMVLQVNGDLISFEQYWWNYGDLVPKMKELHKVQQSMKSQVEENNNNSGKSKKNISGDNVDQNNSSKHDENGLNNIDYCYVASRSCLIDIKSPGAQSMTHQWVLLNSLNQERIIEKMKLYRLYPSEGQLPAPSSTTTTTPTTQKLTSTSTTTTKGLGDKFDSIRSHPDCHLFGISRTAQETYSRNRLLQLVSDYQAESTYTISPVQSSIKWPSTPSKSSVVSNTKSDIDPTHGTRYIFHPPCYLVTVSPTSKQGSLSIISPNINNLIKKATYIQYPMLLSFLSHRKSILSKYYQMLILRSMIITEGFSKQAMLQQTLSEHNYSLQLEKYNDQVKLGNTTLLPPIQPPNVLLSDLSPSQDLLDDVLTPTQQVDSTDLDPDLLEHLDKYPSQFPSQFTALSTTQIPISNNLFDYSTSCYCCYIARHGNSHYQKPPPLPSIASNDHLHQVQHQHPHTLTSFSWLLSRSFVSSTKQSTELVNSVTYYGDHSFINPYQFAHFYSSQDSQMSVKTSLKESDETQTSIFTKPSQSIHTKGLGAKKSLDIELTTLATSHESLPSPTAASISSLSSSTASTSQNSWSKSLPLSYFPLKSPILHVTSVDGGSILTQNDFLHFIYLPLYYHYMTCPHMNLCSSCQINKHPLRNAANQQTSIDLSKDLAHDDICLECLVKQQIRAIHLRFLTSTLTEHIRSLCRSQLPVQQQYYILLILLLIKQQQFQLLHQSLLYGVIDDGLDVVLKLLLMFLNTYQDHRHLESFSAGKYFDTYGSSPEGANDFDPLDGFTGGEPHNQNWLNDIGKHLDITMTSSPSADLLILLDEIDLVQQRNQQLQEQQAKAQKGMRIPSLTSHTSSSSSTSSSPVSSTKSFNDNASPTLTTRSSGNHQRGSLLNENAQFKQNRQKMVVLRKKRAEKEMMLLQLLHSTNLMNMHPFLNLMNVQGIIYEINFITHPKPHFPYIYTQYLQYVLPIISAKQLEQHEMENDKKNSSSGISKSPTMNIVDYFSTTKGSKNNNSVPNPNTFYGSLSVADMISVKTVFVDDNITPSVTSRISPGELQDILIIENRQQASNGKAQNNTTMVDKSQVIPPTPMVGGHVGGFNATNVTTSTNPSGASAQQQQQQQPQQPQVRNSIQPATNIAQAPQYPSMSHFLFPFAQDVWISHYAAQLRSLLNQKTARQQQQQNLQINGIDISNNNNNNNLAELNTYLSSTQDQYLALLQYRHYHTLRFYHTTHVPLNKMYQFIQNLSLYPQFINKKITDANHSDKSTNQPHHFYPIISILDETLSLSNHITFHSLPQQPNLQSHKETTSQYLSPLFHTPSALQSLVNPQTPLPKDPKDAPKKWINPELNPDFDRFHQYPRDLTTPVFSKLHSRGSNSTAASNNPLLQYILDIFFRRNFGLQILQQLAHQQTSTTSALRLVSNKNKLLQTNIKWEMFDSVKMVGSDVQHFATQRYIDSGKNNHPNGSNQP